MVVLVVQLNNIMKNKFNLLDEVYFLRYVNSQIEYLIRRGYIGNIAADKNKISYGIKPKCPDADYMISCDEDEIAFTKEELIESLILKEENRHIEKMKMLNNLK